MRIFIICWLWYNSYKDEMEYECSLFKSLIALAVKLFIHAAHTLVDINLLQTFF